MPYIPEKHLQYNLLPACRERGGEVFSYSGKLLDQVEALLPEGEGLTPYGYDSYVEYDAQIERYRERFAKENPELDSLLMQLKQSIRRRNIKENWAVVRYIGETTESVCGLTHGKCYYWPCSIEHPAYEGVIDDGEFTAYLYPISPELWEVLEDPLGVASIIKEEASVHELQSLHDAVRNLGERERE